MMYCEIMLTFKVRAGIPTAVYLDKRRGAPNALSRGKEAGMRLRYGRMSLLVSCDVCD